MTSQNIHHSVKSQLIQQLVVHVPAGLLNHICPSINICKTHTRLKTIREKYGLSKKIPWAALKLLFLSANMSDLSIPLYTRIQRLSTDRSLGNVFHITPHGTIKWSKDISTSMLLHHRRRIVPVRKINIVLFCKNIYPQCIQVLPKICNYSKPWFVLLLLLCILSRPLPLQMYPPMIGMEMCTKLNQY